MDFSLEELQAFTSVLLCECVKVAGRVLNVAIVLHIIHHIFFSPPLSGVEEEFWSFGRDREEDSTNTVSSKTERTERTDEDEKTRSRREK